MELLRVWMLREGLVREARLIYTQVQGHGLLET